MKYPKKVSVIMGVYNSYSKRELDESIESIIKQTYEDWQFVICDDGSQDDTWEYLTTKYKEDSRFILLRNEVNMGLHCTLNKCIKHAGGFYIMRQDADDVSENTRMAELVAFMEGHPEYDFASSAYQIFDQQGVWKRVLLKETPQKEDLMRGSVHAHAASIFKMSSYERVNGYRVSWETIRCEDYDLFMRMYADGMKGFNIQKSLYNVRMESEGVRKRKYSNRIKEAVVRAKGFKKLGYKWYSYIYVLKPLVIGLIPYGLRKLANRNTFKLAGSADRILEIDNQEDIHVLEKEERESH